MKNFIASVTSTSVHICHLLSSVSKEWEWRWQPETSLSFLSHSQPHTIFQQLWRTMKYELAPLSGSVLIWFTPTNQPEGKKKGKYHILYQIPPIVWLLTDVNYHSCNILWAHDEKIRSQTIYYFNMHTFKHNYEPKNIIELFDVPGYTKQ